MRTWDRIKANWTDEAKEIADDIIDVIEEQLDEMGLVGEMFQEFVDGVRVKLGIPDDIGGDED